MHKTDEIVIVSAVRTPIGKFGGSLSVTSAPKLGAIVVEEAVRRAGIKPEFVDEVIMGNVISAGLGQNVARQCAIYAHLPYDVNAFTVNKVCGSGMKAIMLASSEIKAGDANIVVAGGTENMSLAPYLLDKARFGYKLFDGKLIDAMVYDGLWDVYNNFHMGMTGEIIAEKYGITRADADAFALSSHEKAIKATETGNFEREIIKIDVKMGKKSFVFQKDEGPRADTSIEKLAKLPPVFKKDGIITAGNASQISDGAAAVVIMSKSKSDELGLKPLARIVDYCAAGVAPADVMEAPIPTVNKLLDRTNFKIENIDLFEHNEAFSTASVAVMRELKIKPERFNIRGGAVALGHPIGCSGTRIVVTLLHALQDLNLNRGIATACLGGGNAVAIMIETLL
jgi:acetyl-CoA C-acetyltransferase